jgi:hypothetical protein
LSGLVTHIGFGVKLLSRAILVFARKQGSLKLHLSPAQAYWIGEKDLGMPAA